jgi:hypothetical protein
MEKTLNSAAEAFDDFPNAMTPTADQSDPTVRATFERPSVEEISLCCEISAYAPDDDDRPLF